MAEVTLPGREDTPAETGAGYFDHARALARLEAGEAVSFPPLEIVRARIGGRDVTFCLNVGSDPIQNCHRRGAFYEARELEMLRGLVPQGAHVLDVGANVGNHALWFAMFHGAARVVVVEPNPLAIAPLVANVVLNGLGEVIDLSALGIGLSDRSQGGFGMRRRRQNIGATKMLPGEGALEVHPGDALFEEESFDFIKLDVEGMEMEALKGLEQTIARCRPLMLVEVGDENAAAFGAWVARMGYRVAETVRRYETNQNYLIAPEGAAR